MKIFLRTLEPSLLSQTIDTGSLSSSLSFFFGDILSVLVLQELKENYLENVLISPPNCSQQITLEEFLPIWRVVEDYINKQKILSAGVCDFMFPFFSEFCDACQVVKNLSLIKIFLSCLAQTIR